MISALVADTGGLLQALARRPDGKASYPEYEAVLLRADRIIVPAMVLAEVDYFPRRQRAAMRALVADIFDPASRYEFEPSRPSDVVRALLLDGKFEALELGLVDAMVAAVAERRCVYRVLTTDRRDLAAVRVGPRLDHALELLP